MTQRTALAAAAAVFALVLLAVLALPRPAPFGPDSSADAGEKSAAVPPSSGGAGASAHRRSDADGSAERAEPSTTAVDLIAGLDIPVRPVRIPPDPPWPPNSETIAELQRLRAAGDTRSAAVLLGIHERCASAYRSDAALSEAIDDLYQARLLRLPGETLEEARAIALDADLVDVAESALRQPMLDCRDVPVLAPRELEKLVDDVAIGGYSVIAQSRAWISLQEGDTRRAISLFEAAWNSGSWNALQGIADIAESHGLSSNFVSVGPLGREALAYAYQRAFVSIQEELVKEAGPITQRKKAADRARLDELRGRLYPHEVEQADRYSEQLIASNANCCTLL